MKEVKEALEKYESAPIDKRLVPYDRIISNALPWLQQLVTELEERDEAILTAMQKITENGAWIRKLEGELEEAHKKQKGMISKDKLLEWLKIEIELSQGSNPTLKRDAWAFHQVRQAVRAGEFDVEEGL